MTCLQVETLPRLIPAKFLHVHFAILSTWNVRDPLVEEVQVHPRPMGYLVEAKINLEGISIDLGEPIKVFKQFFFVWHNVPRDFLINPREGRWCNVIHGIESIGIIRSRIGLECFPCSVSWVGGPKHRN